MITKRSATVKGKVTWLAEYEWGFGMIVRNRHVQKEKGEKVVTFKIIA